VCKASLAALGAAAALTRAARSLPTPLPERRNQGLDGVNHPLWELASKLLAAPETIVKEIDRSR
jgi:hypothetical protein